MVEWALSHQNLHFTEMIKFNIFLSIVFCFFVLNFRNVRMDSPDEAIDSNEESGARVDGNGVACLLWIGGGESGNCCESRGDSGNCWESSSIEPAPWAWLWWYFKPLACLYFLLQSMNWKCKIKCISEIKKTKSWSGIPTISIVAQYLPCSGHSNRTGEIAHGVVVFTFFDGICTFRSDC